MMVLRAEMVFIIKMKPDKIQTVEEINRLNERNRTFNKNREKTNSANYKNLWDKKKTVCMLITQNDKVWVEVWGIVI